MPKAVESKNDPVEKSSEEPHQLEFDSKYRMIIIAAQRSKQIQRGARPRVEVDMQRHKPTRVALEEVQRGKVPFSIIERK